MSVKSLKNYDEWPDWFELAEVMAYVAMFKIVHHAIWHYGWKEYPSAVISISRDDLTDFVVKRRMSMMEMARSPGDMMAILGGFGTSIDLSNDSALIAQSISFVNYLSRHSVEPLPNTSSGKAWARMAGYLKEYSSFRALVTFMAEKHGAYGMRERIQRYGFVISTDSEAYILTDESFKEAYPDAFKKGFWASLFG